MAPRRKDWARVQEVKAGGRVLCSRGIFKPICLLRLWFVKFPVVYQPVNSVLACSIVNIPHALKSWDSRPWSYQKISYSVLSNRETSQTTVGSFHWTIRRVRLEDQATHKNILDISTRLILKTFNRVSFHIRMIMRKGNICQAWKTPKLKGNQKL